MSSCNSRLFRSWQERLVFLLALAAAFQCGHVAAVPAAEFQQMRAAVSAHASFFQLLHDVLDIIVELVSPLEDVTLLLPLAPAVLDFVMAAYPKDMRKQIFNYHIITKRLALADMMLTRGGTQLPTKEGMPVIKRGFYGQPVTLLQGRSLTPVTIVVPNIWVGATITVHGISTVLIPPDL